MEARDDAPKWKPIVRFGRTGKSSPPAGLLIFVISAVRQGVRIIPSFHKSETSKVLEAAGIWVRLTKMDLKNDPRKCLTANHSGAPEAMASRQDIDRSLIKKNLKINLQGVTYRHFPNIFVG